MPKQGDKEIKTCLFSLTLNRRISRAPRMCSALVNGQLGQGKGALAKTQMVDYFALLLKNTTMSVHADATAPSWSR